MVVCVFLIEHGEGNVRFLKLGFWILTKNPGMIYFFFGDGKNEWKRELFNGNQTYTLAAFICFAKQVLLIPHDKVRQWLYLGEVIEICMIQSFTQKISILKIFDLLKKRVNI